VTDFSTIVDAGAVHVFAESGGTLLITINNPQAAINDDFGSAVAVAANDDLIVSARFVDNFATNDGKVFVLDGTTGSVLWSVANPLADAEGLFGTDLAGTPQGHVVIGAANDDSGAINAGKVFVFDGGNGDLIKVIGNPSPAANVNFGQGIGVTSAGQIAVGAFGADGGFGTLHLFTSISAGEDLSLLNKQPFADPNLQSCVLGQAAANGWATVSEVSGLDCSDSAISDLTGLDALSELTTLDLSNNDLIDITGLENLTNLTSLDLTGNEGILCADLDALELALGAGVVIRPTLCDSGGGGTQASEVQSLHNALGQRVVKTVDGLAASAIHFIYDQSGQVIAEIDSSTGQTLREYVYVNGLQVALVDDTGTQDEATYFVQNDHLGTPQKITGTLQQVVWAGSYEPFGEVDETVAVIENNVRFPGQYEDGETGLHYNYFRDYDPSLGRYVESDPIGIDGGMNLYAYAYQNAIRYIDKLGLWVKLCARGLGGADAEPVAPRGSLFRHDYLSVSGSILSFQAGSNMVKSQGWIDRESEKPENPKCELVCNDKKFDSYVISAADKIGAPTYCLIPGIPGTKNCQTWAADVIALAKLNYLANEKCPECFKN
jgi:RHS repeat-associated protein